jgi:hypothetical protein
MKKMVFEWFKYKSDIDKICLLTSFISNIIEANFLNFLLIYFLFYFYEVRKQMMLIKGTYDLNNDGMTII